MHKDWNRRAIDGDGIAVLGLIGGLILSLGSGLSAAQLESTTYRLEQSGAAHAIWTSPPSERVFKDDALPPLVGSEIRVYAARNEFEPFQVVLKPAAFGNITVSMGSFGSDVTTELYQVKHVSLEQASDNLGRLGDYPDPLWPIESGDSVAVTAGENTAFWITVGVSASAAAGDYHTTMMLGGVSVPVRLHVFDFKLPDALHLASQMNFSFNTVLNHYGVPGVGEEYWQYADLVKQFFIDHRLTPKAPLWPGGLTSSGGGPFIDYDCAGGLSDPHGIWGFEGPADKYLDGNGFNEGAGFPSFMAATFKNNDASEDQRPSSFCGQTRSASDWYTGGNPNSPYNQAWFQYIGALQSYLQGLGYLNKSYYYLANEPQDQADYDAVAWYSQELKRAAPDLKLMVSEEPRREIFNHPTFTGAKIDMWLPVLQNYDPQVSHDRELGFGEQTWVYFLHSTRPPYFNPITLDHPGIESKLLGWFAWKYRLRGLAYYSLNNWSQNPWTDPMTSGHNGDTFLFYPPAQNNTPIVYGANNHRLVPSIRLELMRDGLEDYEYLVLLNAGATPEVGRVNPADAQVDKIIGGLTAYTRDSEFLYNLRYVLGQWLGGELSELPEFLAESKHPRAQADPGDYYLNFQDPLGEPTTDPLVVNGREYLKIGWAAYDETAGYGWYGEFDHVAYQYLSSGPNPLQRSVLYDDWGRLKTFEFDLPNGLYDVTVSVGWEGRTYSRHRITLEGNPVVDDEETNPADSYLVRSTSLNVSDGKLTLEMGIFDEYTMLNFLDIEAVVPAEIAHVRIGGDGQLWLDSERLRPTATYRVSATADLENALWQTVDSFEPGAATHSWRDDGSLGGSQRFYRVERD